MLREQMNATLSRSDVLKPLAWLVGIIALTVVLMLTAGAPDWMLLFLVYSLVGIIILYAASYVFCLFNDRDSLRSERYSLNKMAIEHGFFGDDLTGVVEDKKGAQKLIESSGSVEQPEAPQ
jgi:hypothetical protein